MITIFTIAGNEININSCGDPVFALSELIDLGAIVLFKDDGEKVDNQDELAALYDRTDDIRLSAVFSEARISNEFEIIAKVNKNRLIHGLLQLGLIDKLHEVTRETEISQIDKNHAFLSILSSRPFHEEKNAMITRFLESGMIDVNDTGKCHTFYNTPLIDIAIMNGDRHAVAELLRLGANPTDRNSSGQRERNPNPTTNTSRSLNCNRRNSNGSRCSIS